jgi:diguanylate cyclase (GGDEF)-like protein
MLEVKDDGGVANAARKIIDNIGQPCEFDGLKISVKASVGIALYPRDGRSVNVLLKNADAAMYKAKQTDEGFSFYALGAY